MMRILQSVGIFVPRGSAGREREESRLLAAKAGKPEQKLMVVIDRSRMRSDRVERGDEWTEGFDRGEDETAEGLVRGASR